MLFFFWWKENETYASINLLLINWSDQSKEMHGDGNIFFSLSLSLSDYAVSLKQMQLPVADDEEQKSALVLLTRLLIRHWIIFYISLVCRVLAIVAGIERRRAEKTMKRQGQSWRSANLVRWTNEKFPPLNAWRENFNDMCDCHWGTGRRRRLALKKYSFEGQVQSAIEGEERQTEGR